MPTAPTRPTNIDLPFAYSGTRNTIPDAPTGSNLASYTQGFPPVTMLPIASGGVPPEGNDFNGLFYSITKHTLWVNAGGQYLFDSALSTAMGGYPKGMVLQNTALNASYVSLIDNNTNNFNSDPSQIGITWAPYSGAAFSNIAITTTGGNTTLSAIQALANMITVSGTLTANATITIPLAVHEYTFINQTTGSFLLTVLPTSGTGVSIKQGGVDYVVCDGTNVQYAQNSAITRAAGDASTSVSSTRYSDRSSSRVGGYSPDTGATNAYVIATFPPTTSYADGQTVRFTPANNNNSTVCTLNAGAGAKSLVRGDGSGPRPNDITAQAVITATYVQAVDKFVINGLIVPDIALSRLIYLNTTATLSNNSYNIDTSAGPFACNLPTSPVLGDSMTIGDYNGSWGFNAFTLVATGGKQIICATANGTIWSDTTLVDNVRGHQYTVYYDGTYWRLA